MADSLHDGIDEKALSFTIGGLRLLPLFIFAVVLAVPIQEVQAEQLLNAIEELLDEPWQFRLDRHLEDVKVLVGAQFLFTIVLISCHLLCGN